MDFTLSPDIEDLRLRVRAFVEEHVLPLEADPENFSEHENIPEARLAKVRGLPGHDLYWCCRHLDLAVLRGRGEAENRGSAWLVDSGTRHPD